MQLVFDIEANALLPEVTRGWCICTFDLNSREERSFGPDRMKEGLDYLSQAKMLIGHFILGYDIPALKKLYGWTPSKGTEIRDTLAISRLAYSNLRELDERSDTWEAKKLSIGRSELGDHSLNAWGIRLGMHKQEFNDFTQYTLAMLEYCKQDVRVSVCLWEKPWEYNLKPPGKDKEVERRVGLPFKLFSEKFADDVRLEQRVLWEYERIGNAGIRFDEQRALGIVQDIDVRAKSIHKEVEKFIPVRVEEMSTPEYWTVEWADGTSQQFPTKGEAESERKARKVKPKECLLIRGPNKKKYHPFNPGSNKQVLAYLVEQYNWISPLLTDTGMKLLKKGEDYNTLARTYGSVKEEFLRLLEHPEAQLFADFAVLKKIRGMVAPRSLSVVEEEKDEEGDDQDAEITLTSIGNNVEEKEGKAKSAWLSRVQGGKMRFRLNHIGCVTHRSSSSSPNLQQVSAVVLGKDKKPIWGFEGRYGSDCRACFLPREDYRMVGTDLSGIEGRMLAHYLAPYDSGEYIKQVLEGDVHQQNVDSILTYAGYKIGRGDSKPCYYGLLYGIGAEKQGRGVVASSEDAMADYLERKAYYEADPSKIERYYFVGRSKLPMRPSDCAFADIGERVNLALARGINGFQQLVGDVKRAAERGYLKVLGRHIPVKKQHSALNTLLQGGAGVIAKRWLINLCGEIRRQDMDASILLVVHDEIQSEVHPDAVEHYCKTALDAIKYAGEYYNLLIPLSGEAKVGNNWQETH